MSGVGKSWKHKKPNIKSEIKKRGSNRYANQFINIWIMMMIFNFFLLSC